MASSVVRRGHLWATVWVYCGKCGGPEQVSSDATGDTLHLFFNEIRADFWHSGHYYSKELGYVCMDCLTGEAPEKEGEDG